MDLSRSRPVLTLPGRSRRLPIRAPLAAVVDVVVRAGGRAIAVGGAVRDHLLGHVPKDIDVEVAGLDLERLTQAFVDAGFGVHAVGRAFGVLKVDVDAGGERDTLDVALPRTENKTGAGHRGFVVASDPHLPFAAAAARRDFTCNAIGIDLVTHEVLDPHGGIPDLERGVLRHVSPAFDEDPLRVLRAAQFCARFGFDVDDDTVARCRALLPELPALAAERVGEELKKLLVKGRWPSLGLQLLRRVGALPVLFPELHALIGCPQEFEWHPEGDVWTHTLMVVDEAAVLAKDVDDDVRFVVVCAALCHDLGKPATTVHEDGRIRSRDHEAQGEAPTRALLARLAVAHADVDGIVALVRDHLKPFQLWRERATSSEGAIRRLALRTKIPELCLVASADHFGRTTPEALRRDDPASPWLLEQARALAVKDAAPKPILQGRDLMARGLKPGPHFGALLARAFEAQLDGLFVDKDGAAAWLDAALVEAP